MPKYVEKFKNIIDNSYEIVILEYGLQKFGHIIRSCEIIKPNVDLF